MRLNGWQRIGIVASVVWAIGAPIYLDHAAQQDALETFTVVHRACLDANIDFDRVPPACPRRLR